MNTEPSATVIPDQDKLDALAELCAAAGHEINNPLAVIAGRAGMLLQQEEDLVKRQSLAAIVGQALRIRDMIGDLMTFANPPQPELERFDPVAAVKEVVAQQKTLMLEQQRDQKPEFILSLPESSRELNADPIQFRIVLAEILRNAWHQSTGPSQIQVILERIENNTESLQLTISNDGRPLTPLEQKHLFDPFFSGRQAGRGLGFGLTKAWRFANLHGAEIEVLSPADVATQKGTAFRIVWPLAGHHQF